MERDRDRGERIAELRKRAGLTQEGLADAVGVTLRAAQEWEAGGGLSADNLRKLAKVVGADPEHIRIGPREDVPDISVGQLDRIEAAVRDLQEAVKALAQTATSQTTEVEALRRQQQREAGRSTQRGRGGQSSTG